MSRQLVLLVVSSVLASVGLSTLAYASSGQHEIKGFHFATCLTSGPKSGACIEVSSPKAWLSQVNGGFATTDEARVSIRNGSGKVENEWKGGSAVFHPVLDKISLELQNGGLVTVSLATATFDVLSFDHGALVKKTGGSR